MDQVAASIITAGLIVSVVVFCVVLGFWLGRWEDRGDG